MFNNWNSHLNLNKKYSNLKHHTLTSHRWNDYTHLLFLFQHLTFLFYFIFYFFCFARWCMWVWEPIQPRLRCEHCSTEHGTVQQRPELRFVLRDQVRPGSEVVQPGKPFHRGHRHQLLPSELRSPKWQWRVVQPPEAALRPRHANVPQDRSVPRRNRARQFPPVSSENPLSSSSRIFLAFIFKMSIISSYISTLYG